MMKNYDKSVEINNNLNWPYIPDQPYRILITGVLGSGKTNVLLNLYSQDIDKIYLYVKDPFELKYQLLINEREKVRIKKLIQAYIDYSQTIDDFYTNLEYYNPTKKRRVIVVFNDMVVDMDSNKKLSPVTKLFLRGR